MTHISIEQSDAAILATFNAMEEGKEYILNDFWFKEIKRKYKELKWAEIKAKNSYIFMRKGQKLFINDKEVFDFVEKTNLAFDLSFAFAFASSFTFTLSLAFGIALALTLILQYGGIEKQESTTIVEPTSIEINGKKFKLTPL